MSGDGDARGLEAAAATAAEAARELREAAAALVATRAAEEDALRRRAVALEADVRRLQASLHALDPSTLDKVEEELERARVAITDSDVASFLPSKRNGKFLKTFLGPVNVRVARKEDKLKIKDEYNNYRDRTAYKFLLFPSILLLLRWWIWDGCLPALAVQIYQAWLLYLYTSFALRENVLIANGSDIRPWWIYHHYLAMLMALISLTWEIKGQPDCSSKQRGVQLFLRWAIMQGIAMHLQNRYQRQRLRTRIALGKNGCRCWRNSWCGGAALAAISCPFHITGFRSICWSFASSDGFAWACFRMAGLSLRDLAGGYGSRQLCPHYGDTGTETEV
uniref:TMPIT-like protein n=1 Tax=Zea mays TaxID=4577 RepID=A0A804PDW4_MAIZE